jgi:hypothetical protein
VSGFTTRPTLRYYQDRLRATIAEPELVSDADLLTFLQDGYARLCERSGCIVNLSTITMIPSQSEYTLPSDHYQTLMIASAGTLLNLVPLRNSLIDYGVGVPSAWYSYSDKIGVIPQPVQPGTISILYEATPDTPSGYDESLDPRCLPEYRYGIVHWVRWRLTQLDGGAQGINKAGYERALFEDAVVRLRAATHSLVSPGGSRMRSIVEQGRALR